jgi:cell division protein FtsZ
LHPGGPSALVSAKLPNEKLLAVAKDAGFFESFRIADDVLRQGVQGISDIITIPGIINRDFADVKTTMAGMGYAVMGTAIRSGANRAVDAAQAAMASPLLEDGAIDGARGILINISGSSSLKLTEVNEASTLIQNAAHEEANIIFGAVLDENMNDEVKITVIATGFRKDMPERRERMLNAVLQPPPIARVEASAQTARPRFASEELEEPIFASASRRISVAVAAGAEPETFGEIKSEDETFFQASLTGNGAALDADDSPAPVEEVAVAVADVPAHPKTILADGHNQDGDNLDIPAFLRRGGL